MVMQLIWDVLSTSWLKRFLNEHTLIIMKDVVVEDANSKATNALQLCFSNAAWIKSFVDVNVVKDHKDKKNDENF